MEVKSIGSQYANALSALSKPGDESTPTEFQNMLLDALKDAGETDAADKDSIEALLSGDVNNLSDAMIATEKADIALRLTVQIRNRVIDAYNEVMRMQI